MGNHNHGPRAKKSAANRAKIIHAAHASFYLIGYDGTTLRDVAAAAGLSTGAIFAQFKGKSDLWLAAYGHSYSPPAARLERALTILENILAMDAAVTAQREDIRQRDEETRSSTLLNVDLEEVKRTLVNYLRGPAAEFVKECRAPLTEIPHNAIDDAGKAAQ